MGLSKDKKKKLQNIMWPTETSKAGVA